jgi:drug/metabolite transporter (DMT)-like permease
MTALLSALWLKQRTLSLRRLFAYTLGIGGLAIMFESALTLNQYALQGIIGILIAAFLQALSSVWVKRIDAKLPAIQQVAGGLLFSLPLYLGSWYFLEGGQWPEALSVRALLSIVYLGVIATTLGFVLYYYILSVLPAVTVSLITLITPVLSLLLGHWVNHEPLTLKIISGTGLILIALLVHECCRPTIR